MNRKIIFMTVILAGCATSTEAHLPDGTMGQSIDCSGEMLTWGDCEIKAGELCKEKGYTVLSEASDVESTATTTYASLKRKSVYAN